MNTYYVATDGNDNNPGTKDKPWATWGKAFNSTAVNAGDTVYFRGGIYMMDIPGGDGYGLTRTGTPTKWIIYSNYQGEVPILDCSNVTPTGDHHWAISNLPSANYVKFIGLTVRNVLEIRTDINVDVDAWWFVEGTFSWERCVTYNAQGIGFTSNWDGDLDGEHRYLNCDAYNCWNPNVVPPNLPGNRGSGFSCQNWVNTIGHTYYKNCRAWKCGDQGWSTGDTYIEIDGCWSFLNGVLQGDGHGFKLGWVDYKSTSVRRVVKNCIAAYNRASGISTNDDGYSAVCYMNVYNNTIYHSGYADDWHFQRGVYVYPTLATDEEELHRVFKNNISYDNEYGAVYVKDNAPYTHENNSWDNPPDVTITDADFLSVDSTGLSGPRQADGSLPNLKFLKLSTGSHLIDAGINVGLPFLGKAPDLGAFEKE